MKSQRSFVHKELERLQQNILRERERERERNREIDRETELKHATKIGF
jgi:hypothetical protein